LLPHGTYVIRQLLLLLLLLLLLFNEEIKECEMGGECSMNWLVEMFMQHFTRKVEA